MVASTNRKFVSTYSERENRCGADNFLRVIKLKKLLTVDITVIKTINLKAGMIKSNK